ncbi:MAG: hypothetical protein U0Z53_10895 [Blastocatellia bacterium]
MLTSKYVDEVMVQGDYMSGDRNAIASALKLNQRLGVLILAAEGHDKVAKEMKQFYQDNNRIEICLIKPGGRRPEEAVKQAYKEVKEWDQKRRAWKPGTPFPQLPKFVTDHVETRKYIRGKWETVIRVNIATWGTQVIANEFGTDSVSQSQAQQKIRQYWRLDHLPPQKWGPTQDRQKQVGVWLESKGFRKDRAYVFLFAKEGDRRAEKAHHFTSILTWRILQERIEKECPGIVPVAVGDDIGLRTIPTMVRFWEDEAWNDIFKGVTVDSRSAQLGMWCYLAEKFGCVSIVGMRSGMIEVPALLGIRTLYLEEAHNQQAGRMAKWIGRVPGYQRQVVNKPPGIKQQAYWYEQSASAKSKDVRDHAQTEGGHVKNIVMGFEKTGLKKTQPDTLTKNTDPLTPDEAEDLANRIFGKGGLVEGVPAEKFMLETSEFDDIIKWIKDTPKPTGGSLAAFSSLKADVIEDNKKYVATCDTVTRDKNLQHLKGERKIRDWSRFFQSKEYLNSIGIEKK